MRVRSTLHEHRLRWSVVGGRSSIGKGGRMEQRVYHGAIRPDGLAQALLDEWDRDQFMAQAFGESDRVVVQIGQREGGWFGDEPHQALTLDIEAIEDGV